MRGGARGWQIAQNVGENRVFPSFLFLACLLLSLRVWRNPVGFRYDGTEWVDWVLGISMDTRPRSPRRGN